MRYRVAFFCIIVFILAFNSCNRNQNVTSSSGFNISADSLSLLYNYNLSDIFYSVPSPHQISLLIKDDCPYFDETIFQKPVDVHQYATSEKKALVLGLLGADLGYLSLYDQKELALKYLDNIGHLVDVSKQAQYGTSEIFKRVEKNLGNSDSMLMIISSIYSKENEAIRNGERPHLGTLIVAGGWIESFYLLNKLYSNTRNSNLFGIILQQQYVLDNLIHSLRPYYKKSRDFTELIDKLVEIAYEYEVVDVNYKNIPAVDNDSITFVKCRFTPILTGSHLERMFELSSSLRSSLIY